MKHRSKLVVFAILLLMAGIIFWTNQSQVAERAGNAILTRVRSISYQFHNHIHGIGYDSQNQRLFVATHYGIFVWQEGHLFQLGQSRDDYMGFSSHPSDPNMIYTSGHPANGGNLGVLKSDDGGVTFRQIFRGLKGETVDFHSMTISPANPNVLYGWFMERLYRTRDGGRSWQFAAARGLPKEGLCFGAPCLAADGQNAAGVYASTRLGLMLSRDFGENWNPLAPNTGAVAAVGVDPANSQRLFVFAEKTGLAISEDGGKTWQRRNTGIRLSRGEFVFAFAFDRQNPKYIFAATPEQVFHSANGGEHWDKII